MSYSTAVYAKRANRRFTRENEMSEPRLCVQCAGTVPYPVHPESALGLCAKHEAERALADLQESPWDMQLQLELSLWTVRAIKLGEIEK